MNYLKFTQYAYLIAGVLFGVDSFLRWQEKENWIISAAFAAVCIFMFFFRRNFAKKFAERNKKP
ncbi:hypothetical protein IVB69_10145 [Flavobacterium sp. J49]|uniref:hypothetical protein n=1 Tax=Flavobacterium sp. J49 TaxID=2718534 RepID=UPI001593DC68|nr:hypothetical protein [Flavobacterium sp. J49]MBF6641839.1 hypothetical protein [Flavobacterium sp. J49]NIC03086.1 hypothetical protein [Flavobacterium sp. J49]